MGLPISSNKSISCNVLGSLLILKLGLRLTDGLMVFLDGPLALSIGSVGVLKRAFKFTNICLQFLLHSEGFSFALGLSFQSTLHAVQGLQVVLPGHFKFFLLLSNATFNLLLNLGQFQLSPEHLVLFLFQGTLELHLLSLQTLPDLVNLMDRPATFADLIHNVLNLIAQEFVLLANLIKLKSRFFIGILDSKQLRRSISALLL